MEKPRLRFNREELKVIHDNLYEEKYETDLMRAEIDYRRAKERNDVNLESWENVLRFVKDKIKTNKKIIKKLDRYFGYDQ